MQRLVTFITDKLFRIVNLENYFHTIFNIKLNNNLLWHKNSVGGMQTELQKTKYPQKLWKFKKYLYVAFYSYHITLNCPRFLLRKKKMQSFISRSPISAGDAVLDAVLDDQAIFESRKIMSYVWHFICCDNFFNKKSLCTYLFFFNQ